MDWVALIVTFLSVVLNARKNMFCWPLGIIACLCWSIFALKTHATALLIAQGLFAAGYLYGWWQWSRNPPRIKSKPV